MDETTNPTTAAYASFVLPDLDPAECNNGAALTRRFVGGRCQF